MISTSWDSTLSVWGTASGCLFGQQQLFHPALVLCTNEKADTGGAFVEGVLMEWMTDPKKLNSWEARSITLKKNASKAGLFEEVCEPG